MCRRTQIFMLLISSSNSVQHSLFHGVNAYVNIIVHSSKANTRLEEHQCNLKYSNKGYSILENSLKYYNRLTMSSITNCISMHTAMVIQHSAAHYNSNLIKLWYKISKPSHLPKPSLPLCCIKVPVPAVICLLLII